MPTLTALARWQPTEAEDILWRRLRRGQLGVHFRRQHAIAGYVVDFYCPSARLAIELDAGDPGSDPQRARTLRQRGIELLRVAHPDVVDRVEAVVETIGTLVRSR